jgi:hypothetical protein
MAIVDITILPWQCEMFLCNDDIAAVVGGFASGKSWWAANWFIDRCMQYPEGQHYIAAKDSPQVKRGPLMTLREELVKRDIEHTYNSGTGEITMMTGCKIMVLSAANYLSFRSLECDTIWADELGDWGQSAELAFTRYLAPRLRFSPTGKKYQAEGMKPMMRITTNPTGIGTWLYNLIVENNFCKCWNVGLRGNYLMPEHAAYVDRQERALSKDLWPFLIDGNWGSVTQGTVYKNFTRALTCTPLPKPLAPMAIDMQKPLLWTHDFNVGLMSSVVGQMHKQRIILDKRNHAFLPVKMVESAARVEVEGFQQGIFYLIDEILMPNSGTPDVAAEFIRRYGAIARQTGVILYGDASGGGKSQQISSQASARSNWAILVQALQREGIKVEFRVQTNNPSVLDRVNEVKAQIETKDGRGIYINATQCPKLLVDLEGVTWKEGTNDIDKSNLTMTHVSDALGYMIWVERTLSKTGHVKFRNPEDQA